MLSSVQKLIKDFREKICELIWAAIQQSFEHASASLHANSEFANHIQRDVKEYLGMNQLDGYWSNNLLSVGDKENLREIYR